VVDFDTALNSTVRRLRAALGDDADTPRYIETVPRRGYRFIGSLEALTIVEPTHAGSAPPEPVLEPIVVPANETVPGWDGGARAGLLAVLLTALIGTTAWIWNARQHDAANVPATSASTPAVATSIAVLPFLNLSSEQDQQYFADGLTEEVLNLLAQTRTLRVIARTSSFSFRDQKVDIATVARKLKVTHVLEGSVRKSGRRVRITAQLIDTATSGHVWSQTYDRALDDPFDVQMEIASSVAGALRVALKSNGATGGAATVSGNAEAHELFLRGRFFLLRRGSGDVTRAQEYYERAVTIDPRFARAWAGLASAHWLQIVTNQAPPEQRLEELRKAAEHALSLDPNLAEAHIRLANHAWFKGDTATGDAHMRKAADVEPNSSLVLTFMASEAGSRGRFGEAIELERRAIETDPLSVAYHGNLADYLYLNGQWAEAKAAEQGAIEVDPSFIPEVTIHILVLEQRYEAALTLAQNVPPGFEQDRFLALAYSGLGRRAEADLALKKMIDAAEGNDPTEIAEVYALRGDTERAFEWLHKSDSKGYWRRYSPYLKELHNDPRWAAWVTPSS
jgi:TolB-like protein/Tfp pilus assembly protein PilF